jgi:Tfp pilus assembly protein FimT
MSLGTSTYAEGNRPGRKARPQKFELGARWGNPRGFSMLELSVVTVMTLVVIGTSIPTVASVVRSYRATGDASNISSQLVQTRMRAAAGSTRARLRFGLAAKTYQMEIYNRTTGQFQTEGGVFHLSGRNAYGFGDVPAPAGTQATIGQADACTDASGNPIAQTACIAFNSRSIPVDSSGAVTSNAAIYLTDGSGGYFSVTASPSGRLNSWRYTTPSWATY